MIEGNKFDAVSAAVTEAHEMLQAVDGHASAMAVLLRGRLRRVSNARVLSDLKRELQDFNSVTERWREEGKK